jgi:uncharacterized protein (TIGR00725 family)
MEALKEIPQIFFDLIARVVPGLLALFVLDCYGVLPWSGIVNAVSGGRSQGGNSFGVALFIVATAYLLGHMLSLISKHLEKVAEYFACIYLAVEPTWVKSPRRATLWAKVRSVQKSARQIDKDRKAKLTRDEIWQKYDWLRVNKSAAGSLAVRIRAEYTMYFSICAVLLLTVFGPNLRYWRLVLVLTAVFTLHRAQDVKKTFANSVRNLYRAANSTQKQSEHQVAKFVVGVMGQGDGATEGDCAMARLLGEMIAKEHWVLLTGGRNVGIMEAANEGAKRVPDSLTIGILPDKKSKPSQFLDIVVITDMNEARNNINVLSSNVIVACGEVGPGTASEIALALKAGKTVLLLGGTEQAAVFFKALSGGKLVRVESPQQAIDTIKDMLPPLPPC